MSDILVDINNLQTEFRTDEGIVRAVNGNSFNIKKGETLGIVGESGSGKSVSALSIMRLIQKPGYITGGEIVYYGGSEPKDLLKVDESTIQGIRGNEISMIFQEPMTSLNPVFTCGNQVMETIKLHQKTDQKTAIEKTLELFDKVKLPDPKRILNSYPHEISGGQKQRVMIAMAMSCNPKVLIADEPTTALDVTVQKSILDLMLKLKDEEDMAIVFITHDLAVISEIADNLLVMYKGNIVERGPVFDVFTRPEHPYTKGLLACRPPLIKRLSSLPTITDFMSVDETGEVKEKQSSVKDEINKRVVTDDERKKRFEKLYAQTPLLKVKNLKTWFPIKKDIFGNVKEWVKAVDDVSFDVYKGETLGLVGESGCGKTTLGRTILRLIEPVSGTIEFEGRKISSLTNEEMRLMRKNIQIIFQDPYSSLNPRLTIGSALMEPMQVHGILNSDKERKKRVLELLEKVNLNPEVFYRYPHEFSGGQRQRICIARALVLDPRFIICDESVSALDVSVQAQVLNLLNQLKKEFSFTYIFISHDLSVVKFMSDRMIVMNKGEIEEMGDADEVYTNPKTEYTQKLISAIPRGELQRKSFQVLLRKLSKEVKGTSLLDQDE